MTAYKYIHISPTELAVQDEYGRIVDQHNMDEFIAAGGIPVTEPWIEPSIPTEQEIIAALTQAVQNHLDTVAATRNYDGILSLCSYATSTNTTFAAEGQAGMRWRDACWAYCYQVMADVQLGNRDIPTTDELVAELPVITW